MWHLASDDNSYVFLRETEEEHLVVAFNNSDQARSLQIPVTGTPAEASAGISPLFGEADAKLEGKEIQLNMPAKSLTVFALD